MRMRTRERSAALWISSVSAASASRHSRDMVVRDAEMRFPEQSSRHHRDCDGGEVACQISRSSRRPRKKNGDRQQRAEDGGQPRADVIHQRGRGLPRPHCIHATEAHRQVPGFALHNFAAGEKPVGIEIALRRKMRHQVVDGAHVGPGIVVLKVDAEGGEYGVICGDDADGERQRDGDCQHCGRGGGS